MVLTQKSVTYDVLYCECATFVVIESRTILEHMVAVEDKKAKFADYKLME